MAENLYGKEVEQLKSLGQDTNEACKILQDLIAKVDSKPRSKKDISNVLELLPSILKRTGT